VWYALVSVFSIIKSILSLNMMRTIGQTLDDGGGLNEVEP